MLESGVNSHVMIRSTVMVDRHVETRTLERADRDSKQAMLAIDSEDGP